VQAAERLAALDRLDEEAHRLLIELQWRSGRLDAARATYAGLVNRLRADLGVDPDPDTLGLGRRLEERRVPSRREAVAPALAAPQIAREEWAFVGRDAERAACAAGWHSARRGRGQPVLITGVAGIGQSRLMHEVLRSLDPSPAALALGRARALADSPF